MGDSSRSKGNYFDLLTLTQGGGSFGATGTVMHKFVRRLLGYGALIIQWKLDIPVKSAPNSTLLLKIHASVWLDSILLLPFFLVQFCRNRVFLLLGVHVFSSPSHQTPQ